VKKTSAVTRNSVAHNVRAAVPYAAACIAPWHWQDGVWKTDDRQNESLQEAGK
jgi:hypothetical protein